MSGDLRNNLIGTALFGAIGLYGWSKWRQVHAAAVAGDTPLLTMEMVNSRAAADDKRPTVDIVFVHGLDGSADATWTHTGADASSKVFWPRDLLGKDSDPLLAGARIWSFGYPNSATWLFGGSAAPLVARAQTLLSVLSGLSIGESNPVVFVTHSMGGLLVKQALCIAAVDKSAHSQVYEKTRGVVFFATPHRGADLARLAVASRVLPVTVSVRTLLPNRAQLLDLNQTFNQLAIPSLSWCVSIG